MVTLDGSMLNGFPGGVEGELFYHFFFVLNVLFLNIFRISPGLPNVTDEIISPHSTTGTNAMHIYFIHVCMFVCIFI